MEIQGERQKQEIAGVEPTVGGEDDQNGNILVACKDEHTCIQLQDCITKGRHKVFKHYVSSIFCYLFVIDNLGFLTKVGDPMKSNNEQ